MSFNTWLQRTFFHRLKWRELHNLPNGTIVLQARCSCYNWQQLRQCVPSDQVATEQLILTRFEEHLDSVGA